MSRRTLNPIASPPSSRRGVAWPRLLLAGVVLCGFVLAALSLFRLQNQIALAETNASITATELAGARHDLEVERLVTQRLSTDRVDLGAVRVAVLSTADTASPPTFAVVWSPTSGEGVLLQLRDLKIPAGTHFRLSAICRPASDRQTSDPVFDSVVPSSFSRGLFTYHSSQPIAVVGFDLEVTTRAETIVTTRYGGALKP